MSETAESGQQSKMGNCGTIAECQNCGYYLRVIKQIERNRINWKKRGKIYNGRRKEKNYLQSTVK